MRKMLKRISGIVMAGLVLIGVAEGIKRVEKPLDNQPILMSAESDGGADPLPL